MYLRQPSERTYAVPGLNIAGKYWQGDDSKTPIIALHGWLDNCASFDRLIPYIPNTVLALDTAGHGLSGRRSPDSYYNIWQDIGEVLHIADQLGWEKFHLLGHSRGAIIGTLAATTFPERIENLLLVDGFWVFPIDADKIVEQMRSGITDKYALLDREPRYYSSYEAAVAARISQGRIPLQAKEAAVLAVRGVSQNEKGFYWNNDPRLRGASEMKLTYEQTEHFISKLTTPGVMVLAKSSFLTKIETFQKVLKQIKSLDVVYVEGNHHLHMDDQVTEVATALQPYL